MAKANEEEVKIHIKQKDIRAHLIKLVRSEHSVLIVDTIIGHLAQHEPGLEQLFLALNGMQKKLTFKPLDEVFIHIDKLTGSWRIDKNKTRASGMTNKDYITATVIEINPYSSHRVKITYKHMDSSDKLESATDWVNENHLHLAGEEFLENLDKEEDDLPF